MHQIDSKQMFERHKTIAIVGLSQNPSKTSYQVAEYLQRNGYQIVPIHPTADKILGQKAFTNLLELPLEIQKTIDIVDIFRPSEETPAIVEQVVQLKRQSGKPHIVWMQLGIENQEAAEKARRNGIRVVMNKCLMKEHKQLSAETDPELAKIRAKKMQEILETTKTSKTSTPITVTDANFEEVVKTHPLVALDCWAAWCGPCRMIAPIIDELAADYAGKILFGKLNVDENPTTAAKFNVMSIPTILIMKNGIEADRIVGAAPKLLIENRLKKHT